MGVLIANRVTNTGEITEEWLESIGFSQRPEMPHGWSCDYGNEYILQLVPEAGGWWLELWNGAEDSRTRAAFPRLLVRCDELLPVLRLMEFIPF